MSATVKYRALKCVDAEWLEEKEKIAFRKTCKSGTERFPILMLRFLYTIASAIG